MKTSALNSSPARRLTSSMKGASPGSGQEKIQSESSVARRKWSSPHSSTTSALHRSAGSSDDPTVPPEQDPLEAGRRLPRLRPAMQTGEEPGSGGGAGSRRPADRPRLHLSQSCSSPSQARLRNQLPSVIDQPEMPRELVGAPERPNRRVPTADRQEAGDRAGGSTARNYPGVAHVPVIAHGLRAHHARKLAGE